MRLRKIVAERVSVVKFRVDNRGSDGTGCFRIRVRTDTVEGILCLNVFSLCVAMVTVGCQGRISGVEQLRQLSSWST